MELYDTAIRHKNPDTEQELIIPIKLVGPVSLEKYKENFASNIKRDVPWLDESEPNDKPALICGAAPSLRVHMDDVKSLKAEGAKIYACNSANHVLIDEGLEVDYQPVLDAALVMADYIHPKAKTHLLASYIDPKCFDVAPNVVLWHPSIDWIEQELKDNPRKFMYIGGGISVAISALCLAYTMGHREMHVFGMDSSYDGKTFYANGRGIAKSETNQLEVTVEYGGKSYPTTYDMKQQVIIFLEVAKLLLEAGCKIKVYGEGLLQDVWRSKEKM